MCHFAEVINLNKFCQIYKKDKTAMKKAFLNFFKRFFEEESLERFIYSIFKYINETPIKNKREEVLYPKKLH